MGYVSSQEGMVSTQWPKKSQSFWRFNFSSPSKVAEGVFFLPHVFPGQLAPKKTGPELRPSFFLGGGDSLKPTKFGVSSALWSLYFAQMTISVRNLPKFNEGRTLENWWPWKSFKFTRLKRNIIWSKLRELKCTFHLYQRLPLSVHLHFGVPNVIPHLSGEGC